MRTDHPLCQEEIQENTTYGSRRSPVVIMEHGAPKGPDQDDKREPVVLEVQPADQSPVLEEIDNRILEILRRYPSRRFKASQIQLILEYQGIQLGSGKLRYRLQVLTILSLVHREKGKHADRYTLWNRRS